MEPIRNGSPCPTAPPLPSSFSLIFFSLLSFSMKKKKKSEICRPQKFAARCHGTLGPPLNPALEIGRFRGTCIDGTCCVCGDGALVIEDKSWLSSVGRVEVVSTVGSSGTAELGVKTLVSVSEPVYSSLSHSSGTGKSFSQFPGNKKMR